MAILTVTTFLTLDGVMQAPGGPEEDPSGGFVHGGWGVPFFDEEMGAYMTEVFTRPAAFLLGRKTYEIFAAYWPKVTDPEDRIATALNALPKHVASKTLDTVEWRGAALVRDVVREAAELKKRYGGELQVHGSGTLVQTLIANDLVDEYNLISFPIILGKGKRLFDGGAMPQAFKLAATRMSPSGVVVNTYRRAGLPTYGTY